MTARLSYGHGEEAVPTLQEARLRAVENTLLRANVRTVLDLGCGPAPLLARLARRPHFRRLVGMDISMAELEVAKRRLGRYSPDTGDRIAFLHTSIVDIQADLAGFDAAVMIETIEHIDPDRLSGVETAVFARCRPNLVVITTPNRECNGLLGVPPYRLRHRDHRFEWDRDKFRAWCRGAAERNGYAAEFADVGWKHPDLGGPTQMAVFRLDGAEEQVRAVSAASRSSLSGSHGTRIRHSEPRRATTRAGGRS